MVHCRQQEVFKSHSYTKNSARLSAKGRAVGGISGSFRPRTASASLGPSRPKSGEEQVSCGVFSIKLVSRFSCLNFYYSVQ